MPGFIKAFSRLTRKECASKCLQTPGCVSGASYQSSIETSDNPDGLSCYLYNGNFGRMRSAFVTVPQYSRGSPAKFYTQVKKNFGTYSCSSCANGAHLFDGTDTCVEAFSLDPLFVPDAFVNSDGNKKTVVGDGYSSEGCAGYSFIKTPQRCAEAVRTTSLEVVEPTVVTSDNGFGPQLPYGCYWKYGGSAERQLWFNEFGDPNYYEGSNGAEQQRRQICSLARTGYMKNNVALCEPPLTPIETFAECRLAAIELMLGSIVKEIVMGQQPTESYQIELGTAQAQSLPHGCVWNSLHGGSIVFNPGGDPYSPDQTRQALCKNE